MSAVFESIGVVIVLVGVILLALEFIHPGALLLIPGSILLIGGMLFLFAPDVLLNSPWGIFAIIIAAVASALIELPYYRYIAPTHGPMTTTSAGLIGQVGVVIAPVVPDTLRGKVRIQSEIWSAHAERPIPRGAKVRVISGEGVSIRVTPVDEVA